LQLLLIIVLICDWAREILTEQVMSSLRRRAGPDYSIIASSSTLDEVVLLEPSLSRDSSRSRTNTPRLDIHEDAQEAGARSEVEIKIEAEGGHEGTRPKEDSSPRGVPAILLNDFAEASSNFTLERAVGRDPTVTTADGTDTHEYVHPRERLTPITVPEEPQDSHIEPTPNFEPAKATEVVSTNAALVDGTDTRTDTLLGEASIPTVFAAHSPEPPQAAMNDNRDDRDPWAQYVVRSGKEDIKLLLRHVSLPEFAYGLHDILRVMGSADTVETARKLLSLFNRNDPFVVESGYINRLRKAWGGDSGHELHTARNLYVCLVWRARFDYQSWTLIKELSCITASKEAIEALAAAGKVSTVSNEFRRKPEASIRAIRLIHPVQYLPIAEVVQAAARNQCLYQQASKGHAGPYGWTEDQSKAAMFQYFWDCFDSQRHAFTECSGLMDLNNEGRIHMMRSRKDISILPLLQVPDIAKQRRIAILKRPDDSRGSGAEYCMFAFDDWHSKLPVIGNAIKAFLEEGHWLFIWQWPTTFSSR
jgi:hypothetical protein